MQWHKNKNNSQTAKSKHTSSEEAKNSLASYADSLRAEARAVHKIMEGHYKKNEVKLSPDCFRMAPRGGTLLAVSYLPKPQQADIAGELTARIGSKMLSSLQREGHLEIVTQERAEQILEDAGKEVEIKHSEDGFLVQGFALNGKAYLIQGNIAGKKNRHPPQTTGTKKP